jgi:hypothetical protein
MNDIVERIRKLRFVHIPGTSDLMEEACQEIERLRQFDRSQPIKPAEDTHATHATPGDGSVQSGGTITDAEREAVEAGIDALCTLNDDDAAMPLRALLKRLA